MKSKAEKEIDYDVHILELQKYRYADQGDDVSADELEVESEQDILLLQSKIKGAVREVKQKRNYAGRYTEEYVVNDLQNYFSNIKNLAMYDYGMVGGEFQKSNSDNGISVSMESRDSVFSGIVPIAQVY